MPDSLGPCFICGKQIASGDSWAADPEFHKCCFTCWRAKYNPTQVLPQQEASEVIHRQADTTADLQFAMPQSQAFPEASDIPLHIASDRAVAPVKARIFLLLAVVLSVLGLNIIGFIALAVGLFAVIDSFTRNRRNTIVAARIYLAISIISVLVWTSSVLSANIRDGTEAAELIIGGIFLRGGPSAFLTWGALQCLKSEAERGKWVSGQCSICGSRTQPVRKSAGNVVVLTILLLCMIWPGILYALLYRGYVWVCTDCGSNLVDSI